VIHATVFAKDLAPMVEFYQLFGFRPEASAPNDFAVLSDGEAELTVVQIPPRIAETIEITQPPQTRSETPIKLTFLVSSIERSVASLTRLRGSTADFKPWSTAGYLVQDFVDPEGNVCQLRQPQ
jgi:catechol 2,3-dioxygenase-like lactoylglutathione lyase family enzyme